MGLKFRVWVWGLKFKALVWELGIRVGSFWGSGVVRGCKVGLRCQRNGRGGGVARVTVSGNHIESRSLKGKRESTICTFFSGILGSVRQSHFPWEFQARTRGFKSVLAPLRRSS